MKKLSLVMSVLLVLTGLVGLFAVPASAASYAADTVAVVNGRETKLEELQDAIDYSTGGGVFEIVKDFAVDSLIFEGMDGVTVKWEIKGNGHTITSTMTKMNNAIYVLMLNACSVTVSNLTIKTPTSGIAICDGGTVELKNVNVYSGGTKEGLTVDAAEREHYASTNNSGLNSCAVHIKATTGASVVIDGGVYKAYGVSGVVLRVERGNAVVKSGTFVGEDCSFVSRIYNQNLIETMEDSGASLTVYDGLFIKPVIDKKAGQKANADSTPNTNTDGCVIRADAGGVLNIYGGKYASFAGVAKLADGTKFGTQRDFVLLAGISNSKPTCKGFINIYGGDFYSFMTNDCNGSSTQLIGNYSGSLAEVNDPEYNKIVANIYGGNFYTTNVQREDNIRSVVDAATNASVRTIQRLPSGSYTATTTPGQTVELYGKTFTDVTKYSIGYKYSATNPDAAAKIKVENKDGTVYYTDDIQLAVNAGAKDGATVTLLDNIAINSLYLYNRAHALTINGNGKTLTCAGTYGIKVYSGDVTIKNLTIDVKGENGVAIQIAKEAESIDSFKLNLVVDGCTLNAKSTEGAVKNLGVLEGSVKFTNTTAGGTAVNINETYTAPEAVRPVLDGDPIETEPVETQPTETQPTETQPTETQPTETTPDNTEPAGSNADTTDEAKGGCGSAIGVGAISVLLVAGLACGIASKKRED